MKNETIVKILQCMACGQTYEEGKGHPCLPIRHWQTRMIEPPPITHDVVSFTPAFKQYINKHYKRK